MRRTSRDIIEVRGDIEQTRNAFYNACRRDRVAAINALNGPALRFPALYALRPEIAKLGLEPSLNIRNFDALNISKALANTERYMFEPAPEHYPVLRWMFMTGYEDTYLGGEYDRIIDAAAILLIKVYGDRSCLRALGDMIFMRHRKGLYTYDAEWAFFESGDPDCLAMAAERLASPDARDVTLARRMLKFLPCLSGRTPEPGRQHRDVVRWLNLNKPYLYYTGESNLQCSEPCRFRVSDECKYLQKGVSDISSAPLSYEEQINLNNINILDPGTRRLLGECSHLLHKSSKQRWQAWMRSPLSVQIESSKRIVGKRGRNDYS